MNKEETLKFFKNKTNVLLCIILIAGVIFMLAVGGDNNKNMNGTSEEERLCRILSDIDGVGDVSVMITYYEENKYGKETNRVKGVIITAQGADDVTVKKAINDSVSAVFEVPAHKICIYQKGNDQ